MTPSQLSATVTRATERAVVLAKEGQVNYARRLATMFERNALILRAAGGGDALWMTGRKVRDVIKEPPQVQATRYMLEEMHLNANEAAEKFDFDVNTLERMIEHAKELCRNDKTSLTLTGKDKNYTINLNRFSSYLKKRVLEEQGEDSYD
jgi:hypothetical protein